jgi:polyisoprenoid-binding protein YceI
MATDQQTTQATKSTWQIDPSHTLTEFSVRHMMITTVRGRFGEVSGTIELDEEDPTRSTAEVTIDARTIDTRADQRDAHLRSADFLDVENHPTITFRSRKIERKGEDRYAVTGELTIRGVTKPVVLDVTEGGRAKSPWGQTVVGFRATTKIDRREFGLKWNQALETGGLLVGRTIDIELDVQAVKSRAADAA